MRRWNVVERTVLGAFLFWSAMGLLFLFLGTTPARAEAWPVPRGLGLFIAACLRHGDPVLLLLAFANAHLLAARRWGAAVARRWALTVLFCAFALETVGVLTGSPFGRYAYTGRFGPQIGSVPLVIPLAWHVVLTHALLLVRARLPFARRRLEAPLAALLCALYDAVLEPFAWKARGYWVWEEGAVPLQNYAAWFVLSLVILRYLAPPRDRLEMPAPPDPRTWIVPGAMLLIFLVGIGRS